MPKAWWQSKTLWLNLLAALAVGAQYFLEVQLLDPELQAAMVVAVNLVLRLVTARPVALRQPKDPGTPRGIPRAKRRAVFRGLWKHTTVNLLAAGLAALCLCSCAGFQVRCDEPTLALRDTATPEKTRMVFLCGDVELASQELDLAELAGATRLCPEPTLAMKGEDEAGNTVVELQCGGMVLATWRLPLKELLREIQGAPAMRPAVLVPVQSCQSAVPGPAEVQ